MLKAEQHHHWNGNNTGTRFVVDAASAIVAAGLVSPVIVLIDKAVAERVSGRTSFINSCRSSLHQLILRPHVFLLARPTRIMLLLYSSTYLTANLVDTASSTIHNQPASTTTSGLAKFSAVSAVNMSLALYKDSQFTKMFGNTLPRPLPPASYVLLALRDSMTIFASFNLPPKVAPMLPVSFEGTFSRLSVAPFATPAVVQVLSSPLHLLGLDLYNRNGRIPFGERMRKVRLDWPMTSLARMCRIIPAFGVGAVVNNNMRASLMHELE